MTVADIKATTTTPDRPAARPVNRAPLLVGIALALGAVGYLGYAHGQQQALLLALGLGLGVALFHSRFGFTSAWRQLIAVGQGKGLRAHAVLLGTTATLFAAIFASGIGFGSAQPEPSVAPIGVGAMFGAMLFGIGMQLGGACASGTLFAVGSGNTAILLTLGGFVAGSFAATWRFEFWTEQLPTFGSYSLADHVGYGGALLTTLAVLALIVAVTYLVERRKSPPPVAAVPSARGVLRVLRGAWPMWAGGVVLAVFNALVLLTSGGAWGVTSAFALWGAKIGQAFGLQPQTWTYWQDPEQAGALQGSILDHSTSLTDLGIIIGALAASALAGSFVLHRRVPWRLAAGAVVGGLLMGAGARLAAGCNIGAYLGGIASFSLHGWVWAAFALLGTWIGLRARGLLHLPNPKPTDSSC